MRRAAFTLLELMIVIMVLGIIMTIAVPAILASIRSANERNASASLKQFSNVQITFRSSDAEQNAVNDYWTGDVSGLYRITLPGSGALRLIDFSVALADGNRLTTAPSGISFDTTALSDTVSAAKAGYYFQQMPFYEDSAGAAASHDYGGTKRHPERYAVAAYASAFGNSGRHFFILSEDGTMYKRDPGGAGYIVGSPPAATLTTFNGVSYTTFPRSPGTSGWGKMD